MNEKTCINCGPAVLMKHQKVGSKYYKWLCPACGNEIICYEDGSPLSQEEYKKFLKEVDAWT